MSFSAPDLFTDIDPTNYAYEIASNFRYIQRALNQIATEFGITTKSSAPSNLMLVDVLLGTSGMCGSGDWELEFDATSTDGCRVAITHPNSTSYAVISSMLHRSSAEYTRELSDVVPDSDGTYRVVVGLNTLGAPAVEYIVEHAESATDESADLNLWSFLCHVVGGTYTVSNLRREATVLGARSSWDALWDRETVLNFGIAGPLDETDVAYQPGCVVPFDCEIVKAYFNLGTAPSGAALEVKLCRDDTDDNVLADSVSWASGEAGVRSEVGTDPLTLVPAGSFLWAEAASGNGTGENLTVTVLLRKVYYDLL